MTTDTGDMIALNRRQERFASWVIDILIYTVVLGLFVEYLDTVVIDSFTITILTALLLKALLAAIVGFEHRVSAYFKQKGGRTNRILGIASAFAILFLSKFVILEAVDIVFGDHVELGGFFMIILLVIAMTVARTLVRVFYKRLGTQPS